MKTNEVVEWSKNIINKQIIGVAGDVIECRAHTKVININEYKKILIIPDSLISTLKFELLPSQEVCLVVK